MNKDIPILVTGSAGFIGFHLSRRLLREGYRVVGLDNLNDYYDVNLKHARNEMLLVDSKYTFVKQNLEDEAALKSLFLEHGFHYVVNLAAQAGVRYSLTNPMAYVDSNIKGFVNLLERCKDHSVKHLVYASSSSVYGANTKMPYSEEHEVNHQISLYAATKRANELIAHSYASNYELPSTGLRFFTVYGPWGRPDMALFIFTRSILAKRPIDVYNHGKMKRDFTYIDDIVESLFRLIGIPATSIKRDKKMNLKANKSFAPFAIYNIGNNRPVKLMDFVNAIEDKLKQKAMVNLMSIQPGDVEETFADSSNLKELTGFTPTTSVEEGVGEFVKWYKEYYQVK